MHPQLELLLELQDLKAQKREMQEEADETSRVIEESIFHVKAEDAIAKLQQRIDAMESELEPDVRGRYDRVAAGRSRAVVPVLDDICYGCFMTMPTAMSRTNDEVRWCENCGSFVYFVG